MKHKMVICYIFQTDNSCKKMVEKHRKLEAELEYKCNEELEWMDGPNMSAKEKLKPVFHKSSRLDRGAMEGV